MRDWQHYQRTRRSRTRRRERYRLGGRKQPTSVNSYEIAILTVVPYSLCSQSSLTDDLGQVLHDNNTPEFRNSSSAVYSNLSALMDATHVSIRRTDAQTSHRLMLGMVDSLTKQPGLTFPKPANLYSTMFITGTNLKYTSRTDVHGRMVHFFRNAVLQWVVQFPALTKKWECG